MESVTGLNYCASLRLSEVRMVSRMDWDGWKDYRQMTSGNTDTSRKKAGRNMDLELS